MNRPHERNKQNRLFFSAFALSVLLHVLILAGGLYLQYLSTVKRPRLKTVDVTLVTLPGPGSPSISRMPSVEPPLPETPELPPDPEPEPEPEPRKPEKPAVAVEPEKPKKQVPKKKPVEKPKPKKPVKDKLQALEKKVKQDQPSEFERTLARLERKVQQGPPSDLYKRTGPGGIGRGEGAYGAPMSPYERYLSKIAMIIQRHWSFTPHLIREKGGIEAYVALTVQPGGTVSDITFDRNSSSRYFDDTVLKAIEKASPFPPVPGEVSGTALRIGLVFTPKGIE